MKWILSAILLAAISASANTRPKFLPHILPDAPSSAYRGKYIVPREAATGAEADVQEAVRVGERNMAWLEHMNSFRPEGKKIQLTKPGDLKGIPIESPKYYNAEIIAADHKEVYTQMPAEMAKILYSASPLTDNPPIDEETYIEWAKKVDRNYQSATRWIMMKPYLPYLMEARQEDLRGFYFLSKKTPNVETVLRSVDSLPADRQEQILDWLTQMCQNSEGLVADCDQQAAEAIQKKTAYEFYLKYLNGSSQLWENYFSLVNARPEITWSAQKPELMNVPFQNPLSDKILNFLKFNIEDEFKWDVWNLRLDFVAKTPVHVEFEPGVTPHVNDAGGDTITMDANAPLTEWDVQWTIRHEFGHVLGFVDCYEEFYDVKKNAIISYQLDIDHLMCARSGRMQKSIYDTLKKYYYK